MKKTVFALLVFCTTILNAQISFNSEGFDVNRNDLELNEFKNDSTANALILYDYGKSFIDNVDYNINTKIKSKVKILNKEGFDKATISIHLYNNERNKEKVENIVAETYNLVDGAIRKTRLKKADIFEERYDENHSFVKFTLPNVKEGSVIVYSYTLISPFRFKYKGWQFQHDIPTLYSEYNTSIPGNWIYNIKLVGGKKLFKNESEIKKNCLKGPNGGSANCAETVMVMKNVPAFIEEDYMTATQNYLARVDYELKTFHGFDGTVKHYTKSWKSADKEFRTDKEIGRQLRKNVDADEMLGSDILNEDNELKKAQAIYRFVQQNYTWNEEYRIFKNVSIRDLLKNKSGNVSSINILLHNLLNESGIVAKPVLISTRNNGFPTKLYPVITDFNYLVVQATINNKTYLLDATDNYLSFGDLPYRCLNLYGRLMDFKNGSDWIDIVPNTTTSVQFSADLSINEEEVIIGKVSSKTTSYQALRTKKSYFPNPDQYITELENNYPNLEISNHTIKNNDITSPDFVESYDIEYFSDETGDNIYLNPFFITFFSENPFKLQERTYPIDFGYKNAFYYTLNLKFGDNYIVEEKPEDLNLVIPNNKGQVQFFSKIDNDRLQLIFKINLREAMYAAEYYPYLKELMSKAVDIQKNSLILLKKK